MKTEKPTIGVLEVPYTRSGDYLHTLQEWGDLPKIISVPEAAELIGKMCGHNPAALQKLFEDAILSNEIRFWGLSHHGGWKEDFLRVFYPKSGKPRISPKSDGTINFRINFAREGERLHSEAMGVNPSDILTLLRNRGRAVPPALHSLVHDSETTTPAKPPAPAKQHKLRKNSLDAPIEKAIKQAGGQDTAAVYVQLRELALNCEPPFTGALDGAALCYTNDNNKPDKLTKSALGKRLKRTGK